jgi:hypothetical protein
MVWLVLKFKKENPIPYAQEFSRLDRNPPFSMAACSDSDAVQN